MLSTNQTPVGNHDSTRSQRRKQRKQKRRLRGLGPSECPPGCIDHRFEAGRWVHASPMLDRLEAAVECGEMTFTKALYLATRPEPPFDRDLSLGLDALTVAAEAIAAAKAAIERRVGLG